VFVRLTREIPQLLIRPSGVSIEIGDSSDTHEVFAIEFDSIFEPYDTKRLSKREKQLFKLLNSFKGQELEQGSYDGTDEELSLEYFWGGGYDLKRLTEILGGTVRRSSKVFYSDEGVVIPTLVEMRNPEDMARCTKVLVQGKMKGIKRPSGCEETYLHNDPRPVGPGNSGLLYNRTLSEQAAKEVMLMCTGITYAYMSGEVIDLPDASKAVREPRPVKSQYFTDVMPGFSWAWKHRYWVTPVAQRFYNDVGIWLICQNLSSAEEKVTAIRLTGPDGSELRCDETLSSQGHLLTWRLHQIGKWVPDCLYTNEGRKRRKIHESNIKVSVVSSFEV
jgi:hypothetical protein